jgi:hypothetical protein
VDIRPEVTLQLRPELAAVLNVATQIYPGQLASRVAEICDMRAPTRSESIEILVALTLDVSEKALSQDENEIYVGVLFGLDIPELDRAQRWIEQVVAAQDLGVLSRIVDRPSSRKIAAGIEETMEDLFWLTWEGVLGQWADELTSMIRGTGRAR